MNKCENCIHYDVCDKQKITNYTISKSVCKHFKDKSLFIELPSVVYSEFHNAWLVYYSIRDCLQTIICDTEQSAKAKLKELRARL